MTTAKFKVGDIVRHKASKCNGIIQCVGMRCRKHIGINYVNCPAGCDGREFSDRYGVKTDFDKLVWVPEIELEEVPEPIMQSI